MKLLFYISTIRGGGAARVMVNLANEFVKEDQVYFVTNFPAEYEYMLAPGIQRISLEREEMKQDRIRKNFFRISGLRKILKEIEPDVSISFMRENNFRLLLAAIGVTTKTIVSVRNDPAREYRSRFSKIMAAILYRKADGTVFQTEDAKLFFPRHIQEKSKIIFNQVDKGFYQQNNTAGEYIIASGRLSDQKNYPMLLNAFVKVHQKYPEQKLLIYGEGVLREELENMSRVLGIDKAVRFMGFSQNMAENYKNAKFLVMTSYYEGLPNVLLEALASSVPVISTDCPCGGPKMIVEEGVNGFLVPVGDSDLLAEKMCRLLEDRECLREMKKRAFLSAQEYTSDKIFCQWRNYIHSVL